MFRSHRSRLLLACLALCAASIAQNADNEETDGQSSRKILGSSVVTSVSVVMETGNGKHTYFSDAVGHPLSKPHIASQVASPINLLNPDRYEFYTFNDDGELVKRLMTLEEIQGIIAGGDGEASNYNSEYHAQIHHPENDVSGVVENVQNVLKEEMEAHKNPMEDRPIIDTPDVSSTWNLILPAFFGGDTVTIRETPEENYNYVSQMVPLDESTERMNVSSRNPEDTNNENFVPNMIEIATAMNNMIHSTTESRTVEESPSTSSYSSSIMTENTKPIPIVITTENLKLNDLSSSSTMNNEITSELPVQTKVMEEENLKDIYTFDVNNIEPSTEINLEDMTDSSSTSLTTENNNKISTSITTENNNKISNFPDITERINLKDKEEILAQTIEYPKVTELVSMITRPTIKASEKTTTASVTFPPTTQFTHSGQISQTSTTLKPVSIKEKNTETPPTTVSDIINDNFIILSLNDKNNNLEQDLNNKTLEAVKNESVTQLDATKYDVISNVEQIIENITKNVVTDNEKIPVEHYNATEEIQEILKSPDFNKTVTLASSIVDSNKILSSTENIPLITLISSRKPTTTEKQELVSEEGSTPILQSTFGSTPSTQVTQKVSPLTTMQKIQILTTTPIPYLKENPKTTTTEKISTTSNIKTTTAKITTMIPLFVTMKQSSTSEILQTSNLPISSKTEPSTISTETTKLFTTTPTTTTSPEFIANRFKEPSTTPSTSTTMTSTTKDVTTKLTTNITKQTTQKLNVTTTQRTTTQKITTPLVVTTTTKKQTITTPEPEADNLNKVSMFTKSTMTTNKPITNAVTFITKQNNSIQSTTMLPKSTADVTTRKPILPSSTTAKIAQPLTVTTKIIPTTISPSSTTIGVVNISEPYRRTEDLIQLNKIPTTGDTWKLVDTVKPPETTSNKMQNTTVVVTTPKPLLEPYQPPIKVDLSTQGNFGVPGLSEDMFMFSKMYNELALKFWSSLSIKDINSERSAVVSPFGTISMLAMIFLGARGGTSGEMNDVLKLDDIVTFNPHLVFKEVTEAVIARKSPAAIVRELYSDSYKGKVLDFYKERVRQFYDGHVEEVDFKKIHNVIRRRTNALISKQTRGQLPQYLEETTLFLRAPLSALSTNIFQADCSQGSTEGRDGELYFIVLPSIRQRRLVPIPAAVWRTGFIAGYDPELDATAVSLGTMNQAVSTVFVMPGQQGHSAPGDVLLRLEARLINTTYLPEMWTQLLKSMLPRPGLEIQLPRFLHKSVINTTDALKRMGLKEMFNKNKADLRGLNGNAHDLHLSDVMQVNEFSVCGETQQMHTEIYPSMTEHLENHNDQMRNFKYVDYFEENEYDKYLSIPLPLRPRQARLPEVPRLRFDRPFLYFVRHNPTGLILHMGRFNPRLLT